MICNSLRKGAAASNRGAPSTMAAPDECGTAGHLVAFLLWSGGNPVAPGWEESLPSFGERVTELPVRR